MAAKGKPASAAEREAARRSHAKSRATIRAKGKKRRAMAKELEKTRHQQLVDGDITVRDLELDELARGRCANVDGSFEGRAPKMPDRFITQMEAERVRRIKAILKKAGPEAAQNAVDLMYAENENVSLAATKFVIEHNVGKTPDIVHIGAETAWDRLSQTGFLIARGGEDDMEWSDEEDTA